jgi:sorbitol-specific phosphotransferase system component IIA
MNHLKLFLPELRHVCLDFKGQIEKELPTRLLVDGIEMVFVSREELCTFWQEYYS